VNLKPNKDVGLREIADKEKKVADLAKKLKRKLGRQIRENRKKFPTGRPNEEYKPYKLEFSYVPPEVQRSEIQQQESL